MPPGFIALKGKGAAGAAGAEAYDEFAPFEFRQYAEREQPLLRFSSFSDAVDEYFSKLEAQRAAQALAAQQGAAFKKVDKIRQTLAHP